MTRRDSWFSDLMRTKSGGPSPMELNTPQSLRKTTSHLMSQSPRSTSPTLEKANHIVNVLTLFALFNAEATPMTYLRKTPVLNVCSWRIGFKSWSPTVIPKRKITQLRPTFNSIAETIVLDSHRWCRIQRVDGERPPSSCIREHLCHVLLHL